ncbi:MAG: efflux RND transporter permease subunit, partial [bacterium]|nr:efflux RND transporter permease subunit [bacterium]
MASERAARDEHLRGINDSEMEVVLRPGRPKPELLAGSELTVLRSLAGRNGDVVAGVPGIVDLPNQEQASVAQLLIDLDRESMARHGLTPAAMARAVEALFQGVVVGEIVEDGIPSRVVVRFPERLRSSPEDLAALPVTTPQGRLLRLDEVASIRSDLGPGIIRRENVGRVA